MQSQTHECIFRRIKCKAVDQEQSLRQLRESNVIDFIHKVCSYCIKKQYASTKEMLARRRYVVVNTL